MFAGKRTQSKRLELILVYFHPIFFRSAATSKVDASGTSITTVLQSASWSKTSSFKKFYLKAIQQVYPNPNNEDNFGMNLLLVNSNSS